MEYKKPQVSKLVDISKERHNSAKYRIKKVIYELLETHQLISINRVADRAGITRQAIYSNPELKNLIDYYRIYFQGQRISPEDVEAGMFDISNMQAVESVIDELMEENKKLNMEKLELEMRLEELHHMMDEIGEIPKEVDLFRED